MDVRTVLTDLDRGVRISAAGAELSLEDAASLRDATLESADVQRHDVVVELEGRDSGATYDGAPPLLDGPLSTGQLELWMADQLSGGNSADNLITISKVDPGIGQVEMAELVRALLVKQPAWRTTFHVQAEQPIQRIASPFAVKLVCKSCRVWSHADFRAWLEAESAVSFDLSKSVLRSYFLKDCPYSADAARANVLVLMMPHIVADFASAEVYVRELNQARANAGEPAGYAGPTQADFARREAEMLEGARGDELRSYWKAQLAGAAFSNQLPWDEAPSASSGQHFSSIKLEVPSELGRRVRMLGRSLSATPYVTMLTCYVILLHRYTNQADVIIGSPVSIKSKEFRDAIGFFANILPLRVVVEPEDGFAEVLAKVKATVDGARKHSQLPFAEILRQLGLKSSALAEESLFQSTFAWERLRSPAEIRRLGQREQVPFEHVDSHQYGTNHSLGVLFYDDLESFAMQWAFDSELFRAETISRMMKNFLVLLEGVASNVATPIGALPVLSSEEAGRLLGEFNATARPYPEDSLIHQLFEAQVARTPDAVALVFAEQRLSYAELNARANRLAHELVARGVKPDSRVAICVERSVEMVVGLLGILKAGGAYVPLDPAYPAERLRHMLMDCEPCALLGVASSLGELRAVLPLGLPVLDLATGFAGRPERNLDPATLGLAANHLAYVIYTSGSTGVPKGAMNEHRPVLNRLRWIQDEIPLQPTDALLQKTPFSFDVSVGEFFWPLLNGARLVLARPDGHKDPAYLTELIRREGITTIHFVPSMLPLFLEHEQVTACTTLKRVLCSGEALTAAAVQRFYEIFGATELVNLYGPTEAAVEVTAWRCARGARGGSVPIGRPIANTRMYVLDAALQPVPIGVVGELYIGGTPVCRGYFNRPELTAERFLVNPFGAGRLYKTGDLARWRADGALEYLGRNDFQVKLRGYRIELGEIEARLLEHPDVREAVVLAREDPPLDLRLVGYLVANAELSVEELRAHLLARLPEYMVPLAFVRLAALPLTPNGKLDRRSLPAPSGTAYTARAYEAPRGDVEARIAQIWSEVLRVEPVGRHDNFFELGGHSLLAVALVERMRAQHLQVDVRVVFAAADLAELAAASGGEEPTAMEVPANLIHEGCQSITPELLPLVALSAADIERIVATVPGGAANVQDIYPLTALQEGMLVHHLMAKEGDPYLLSGLYSCDSRSRLEQVTAAMQAVVDRHDVLRTAVLWEGLSEPVQVVWRKARLQLEELRLDAAAADIVAALRQRVDPRRIRLDLRRAPLMHLYAVEDESEQRWLLLILLHHLAGDHTTLDVMWEEVRAQLAGEAARLPKAAPFRNLVAQARGGVSQAEHERFFRQMLAGVDEPTAPFGTLDAQGDGRAVAEARLEVDKSIAKRLRERARRMGVSAASLVHQAWALVLARLTGRDDVVFGTVLLGRLQSGTGAERGIGLFMNTLPLRIGAGGDSVEVGVRRTQALLAELMQHEHASLALAQRCSQVTAPTPLFTSLLNYRHSPGSTEPGTSAALQLEGVHTLHTEERTNYPVALDVDDVGDGFWLTAQVDAAIEPGRVCAFMHSALERLVSALERAPATELRSLDVLPESERGLLLGGWNATSVAFPTGRCVNELFEAVVRATPQAVAVACGAERSSYLELNQRSNQLARYLRDIGVGPDQRVCVCVERGFDMVLALLAVWKAGGCYVPLDPAYPAERIAYIVQDCAPLVILSHGSARTALGTLETDARIIDLGDHASRWALLSSEDLVPDELGLTSRHLAYVIYTSGSTGVPKGVMIEHESLANYALDAVRWFGLTGEDRVLQQNSLNFDLSLEEVVPALLAGATLVPSNQLFGVSELEPRPTFVHLTAAHWHALVGEWSEEQAATWLAGVRMVNVTGDAVSVQKLERWDAIRPRAVQLINTYGPTEATISCSAAYVTHDAAATSVTIGRPFSNTRIYILDEQQRPAPVGVLGELYIAGVQVGRGYLNRPELTRERFVTDPFSAEAGARMYRTGDLGRWQENGSIEFSGRRDQQVKVRGFRIELGEIETCLAQTPGVAEVVVIAREDAPGEKRLVAYYTGADAPDAAALRERALRGLPEYMVPAAFLLLDTLPLTPNGKLDRKALRAPEGGAYATGADEPPLGETEAAVARIWCELLKLEQVGRSANFFELGGHSLLATRLVVRVAHEFGVELRLLDVFEFPRLSLLAERILEAQLAQFDAEELNGLLLSAPGAPLS